VRTHHERWDDLCLVSYGHETEAYDLARYTPTSIKILLKASLSTGR
jgi:hypothetical protein